MNRITGTQGGLRGEHARAENVRQRARGSEDGVAFERRNQQLRPGADYVHRERTAQRAAQTGTAGLLDALIEQMGGARLSTSKGAFLSLSV